MDRKTFRTKVNFETLARLFFDLAEERYPSAEKANQLVSRLIDPLTTDELENIHLKIAIFNSLRTMTKEVSPTKLYRSSQHQEDLYYALIEASENAEDTLEEIQEELEESLDQEEVE